MTIDELIDAYWDCAYKEGQEGRTHDTENGDAQRIRAQITAHLARGEWDGEVVARINRERCVEIAKEVARKKATMHSYYAEPFQPHAWVIEAMMIAAHDDHPCPVVPDVLKEMDQTWIGGRMLHLLEVARKVPGWTGNEVPEGCCSDQEFNDAIEQVDRAIGIAMLAAAPESGGV